jgi:plastocyanin
MWKGIAVGGVLVIPLIVGAPAQAENKTVILTDERFSPREVTVSPGDSVTWRHRDDDTPHSVTFEDGYDPYSGCSEPDILNACMQEGDTAQRTFLLAGSFRYYCRIHQADGMTGVVNVLGAGGAATTTTTRPTGGEGSSSSSSSSSTTSTTELVVSTSTTRPAAIANIPTTTTAPRPSYAPAPRAAAPPLNPDARDNSDALAALPPPPGGDASAAGGTGGDDSGGSLGLAGGLAVAIAGVAGVLAWKFRPRGRIA